MRDTRTRKLKTNQRDLQSLIGFLLYIHKYVRPARLFVNRILAIPRDVAWFNALLPAYNDRVYFEKHFHPPVGNLYVDVSLNGVGSPWGDSVYALPLNLIQGLPPDFTIVHLEMINVFIALNLWKRKLQGRSIVIHCDNMAVVN